MKFIHFGCWNNGLCAPDQDNGLTKMTRLLNKYVSQPENKDNIEFITVAGDNYYPSKITKEDKEKEEDKEKKIKIFDKKHFVSGFKCLPKNIKKYILFGNHEIEDNVIDNLHEKYNKDSTYKKLKPLVESCKSLILQTTNKDSIFDTSYKFFNDVITITHNQTLIIMFDTTIYTFKDENYLKKINETCYKHLFKNNTELNEDSTIQNLMEYQEEKIKEAIRLNSTCTNIIFIGHHPIISKVYKEITNKDNTTEKKNVSDFNSKMITFFTFFNSMPESLNKKTIYYLCADTHFYQQSEVIINNKLTIHQYIVGTGGADKY